MTSYEQLEESVYGDAMEMIEAQNVLEELDEFRENCSSTEVCDYDKDLEERKAAVEKESEDSNLGTILDEAVILSGMEQWI
jgi:hypothetical protein